MAINDDGTRVDSSGALCPACTRSFSRDDHLSYHLLAHCPKKAFMCSEDGCDKRFTYKATLIRHQRALDHHGWLFDIQALNTAAPVVKATFLATASDKMLLACKTRLHNSLCPSEKPQDFDFGTSADKAVTPSGRLMQAQHQARAAPASVTTACIVKAEEPSIATRPPASSERNPLSLQSIQADGVAHQLTQLKRHLTSSSLHTPNPTYSMTTPSMLGSGTLPYNPLAAHQQHLQLLTARPTQQLPKPSDRHQVLSAPKPQFRQTTNCLSNPVGLGSAACPPTTAVAMAPGQLNLGSPPHAVPGMVQQPTFTPQLGYQSQYPYSNQLNPMMSMPMTMAPTMTPNQQYLVGQMQTQMAAYQAMAQYAQLGNGSLMPPMMPPQNPMAALPLQAMMSHQMAANAALGSFLTTAAPPQSHNPTNWHGSTAHQ
eukprot:m.7089 g.7089  ORF g.7089 m.7089 type:complete len:428 (+) comp8707_c0_seq1:203-1486(+)